MKTIQQAGIEWLKSVSTSREKKTYDTYKCALKFFFQSLTTRAIIARTAKVTDLNERAFTSLIEDLHEVSVATEKLYITAVRQFYYFLSAEDLLTINREKIDQFIKQRARRPGVRLPEFPEDAIAKVIHYIEKEMLIAKEGRDRLRDLRDRAFILTLADTGLRVDEACKMLRGEINWTEKYMDVIGKRNKQATVKFSKRSAYALKLYLNERGKLDGATGKSFVLQPVFARHDLGTGSRVSGISTTTGRAIVERAVVGALGAEIVEHITPHKFRHFFISKVYEDSQDPKLTQELARHDSPVTTARYIHKKSKAIQDGYDKAIEKGVAKSNYNK